MAFQVIQLGPVDGRGSEDACDGRETTSTWQKAKQRECWGTEMQRIVERCTTWTNDQH